jgi:transposase-like protein
MRRKQFTDEQIIGILKEAEARAKCSDLCRRHGISRQTFYRGRRARISLRHVKVSRTPSTMWA